MYIQPQPQPQPLIIIIVSLKDENLEDQDAIQKNRDSYLYALSISSLNGSTMISDLAFITLFVLLGSITFS